MPSKFLHRALGPRGVSIDDLNGEEGKAMRTETRMAIEQSEPMPQLPESGERVRYETKVFSHWDRQSLAEVDSAFTYEISWIPERQCWRSFLCFVGKFA